MSCGRNQPLDKAAIETVIGDNAFDDDVTPLSSYHGKYKDILIDAKNLALSMGTSTAHIFLQKGGKGLEFGKCSSSAIKQSVIIFIDEVDEKISSYSEEDQFYFIFNLFISKWAHCSQGIKKDLAIAKKNNEKKAKEIKENIDSYEKKAEELKEKYLKIKEEIKEIERFNKENGTTLDTKELEKKLQEIMKDKKS